MKKLLLLLAVTFGMGAHLLAAEHIIIVADFAFAPNSVTVHPGDIVHFKWANGTHTSTSTIIPAGASSWDTPMGPASPDFMYTVPNILGVYNFRCTPHESMGMIGSFTVVDAAGVNDVSTPAAFSIYPNPAVGFVHMQLSQPAANVSVTMMDLMGKEVIRKTFTSLKDTDLDLQNVPQGIYVISTETNGQVSKQQLSVTR